MFELDIARAWHKIYASHLDLYITGIEIGKYDPDKIADSSSCDLGQWLQRAGATVTRLPHFKALREPHDTFHRIAAEMVRLHQSGQSDVARNILDNQFKVASQDVLSVIDRLVDEYAHLGAGATETSVATPTLEADFQFDDSLLIGVPVIDDQHKALAELVARLAHSPGSSNNSEHALEILSKFLDLILQHFETEEMYMRQCGMPKAAIDEHVAQHSVIIEEIATIEFEAMQGSAFKAEDLLAQFRNWVSRHLQTYDFEIKQYVKN